MPIPEINQLNACLNDFGCRDDEIAEIIHCRSCGDVSGMIQRLRKRRQCILNAIHLEEKQISRLDYLVFQLEKEKPQT